jgi:tRNA (guanine26-N2/guanine27-N2)-dimethyltransferase
LAAVQQQASKYGRYIVPLISCSIDFYVRLFIRVFSKQGEAKKAWSRVANVYQCSGCSNFHLQPLARTKPGKSEFYVNTVNYDKKCEQCGWNFHLGGPIWSAPIHDIQFVKMCIDHVKQNRKLFSTEKRLTGMLTVISKELTDVPLYYVTPALTIDMKSEGIPINTLRYRIYISSQSL